MIAEITGALAGAKAMKETAQTVLSISSEFDKVELRLQILQLIRQLEEHTIELTTAKAKVAELEGMLKLKPSLTFRNNAYWFKEGDKEEGPICSRCWDADTLFVRMHTAGSIHFCPTCKSKDNYTRPAPRTIQSRPLFRENG